MNTPRILLLNDLHLEFAPYEPETGGYDLVVLAGDIHTKERGVRWARDRFTCPVLYIPGNHEGYGTHWEKNILKMKKEVEGSSIRILERDVVVIDGVRYLGATGWTTFDIWHDPVSAMNAAGQGRDFYGSGQRDYRLIRTGPYRRLLPRDTAAWSAQTRAWLIRTLAEPFDGPTVVITHHAPSVRSLVGGQVAHILDAADANAWDDLIEHSGASLWLHGHTHHKVDYRIGATRVVSNPRGYPGQQLDHDRLGIWVPEPVPPFNATALLR